MDEITRFFLSQDGVAVATWLAIPAALIAIAVSVFISARPKVRLPAWTERTAGGQWILGLEAENKGRADVTINIGSLHTFGTYSVKKGIHEKETPVFHGPDLPHRLLAKGGPVRWIAVCATPPCSGRSVRGDESVLEVYEGHRHRGVQVSSALPTRWTLDEKE